jgi:hypothetical protein
LVRTLAYRKDRIISARYTFRLFCGLASALPPLDTITVALCNLTLDELFFGPASASEGILDFVGPVFLTSCVCKTFCDTVVLYTDLNVIFTVLSIPFAPDSMVPLHFRVSSICRAENVLQAICHIQIPI